jgi:outer membrane protein OmpA-like peptidoglycan-associated protein
MAETMSKRSADETSDDPPASTPDEMSELRRLLLSPEQAQINRLDAQINDPRRVAEDVSRVLPEAISLRSTKDKRLTKALMPTIEAGLTASVKKDPTTLANAIFPVIGPAIRKTIVQIFRQMVQSLNQTLEHSFSIQGVKWRIEAWRTGRPFAEVVLSHTLLFSVEQVFLIHKETGLMLQHVARPSADAQDADLVSGMFTAIQDFVQQTLGGGQGDALDYMEVGNLTVWVERGQYAALAAVIRGSAPTELRADLQDALDSIQFKQRDALASFDGNTAPFAAARSDLESCLQIRLDSARQKRTSPLLWAALAAITIAIGVWMFFIIRDNRRWDNYVSALNREPGLVVIATGKRDGKRFITGLRDPLAIDPASKFADSRIMAEDVVSRWEPYQSAYPEFVVARAKAVLQPPDTVTLKFDEGNLQAEGFAPRAWIVEARRLAPMIPGVTAFATDHLIDADADTIKQAIETRAVFFEPGSAELAADQTDTLVKLAADIQLLDKLAQTMNKAVGIEVTGHTDQSGTENENLRLRQQRADAIRDALTARGVSAEAIAPRAESADDARRSTERKITLRVTLTDAAHGNR